MAVRKRKHQPHRIKNTPSGKRAIAGAKAGKDRIKNPDGTNSSIRTATFGVEIDGKKRVMIAPTVVKTPSGQMRQLTPAQAVARARRTGDFAVVRSQRVADRRSKKFSKRLGKISKRAAKR